MVGTLTVAGSRVLESGHSSSSASPWPWACLMTRMPSSSSLLCRRKKMSRQSGAVSPPLELGSSFVDSAGKVLLLAGVNNNKRSLLVRKYYTARARRRTPLIVNELAGQYEDSFEDVKTQMLNYFTYKAVRTVMHQLYEMNPPLYTWFYNFVVSNKPGEGKRFLKLLVKENQELAERVMTTRLHLYGKWIKKCNHAEIYKEISDENLELMRERLMETVIWPSDDTNPDKMA